MYIKQIIKQSVIFLLVLTATLQSCRKARSDIGAELFKESKNKVFKKVDSAAFYKVFREVLEESKDSISNSQMILDYYRKNEYEPHFVLQFIPGGGYKELVEKYSQATSHGLNPEYFDYARINALTQKLYNKKGVKTVEEAYQTIAKLELLTANSLLKYATAMQYGLVNPRKIFARYYMETGKPDSAFYQKVFTFTDMGDYLNELQPQAADYKKLQQALESGFVYPGLSQVDTRNVIALNLERLRWKNKPATDRYVWVNIPDYTLRYVDGGKTKLTMKVCVGEGPTEDVEIADYDESAESVRPHNHTTPQLNSEINNVQVNPVWNIPESIAKNEIIEKVKKDPYYLVNNNINVYKNGSQVDGDNVDWSDASAGVYSFKQAPGDDNALGKIKFQFPNSSSVYLHDTPAKAAFDKPMRAVSHGCVRLERPIDFAQALFGEGAKLNTVKQEIEEKNPTSRDIAVSPKVPVYLDYMTCFVDDAGQIKIVPDVYKLDQVLYKRTSRVLAR